MERDVRSRPLARRLGVNSLPYVVHVPGSLVYKAESKARLDKDDRMTPKSEMLPWNEQTFQVCQK